MNRADQARVAAEVDEWLDKKAKSTRAAQKREREARMELALARAERGDDSRRREPTFEEDDAKRTERLDAQRGRPKFRTGPADSALTLPCTDPTHRHCTTCRCPMWVFVGERRRIACYQCISRGVEPFPVDVALLARNE